MRVELLFFEDCPNVPRARELLADCLADLGLDVAVEEHRGEYGSPTILVDGHDIMEAPPMKGRACRLDLPTKDKLVGALVRARARRK